MIWKRSLASAKLHERGADSAEFAFASLGPHYAKLDWRLFNGI